MSEGTISMIAFVIIVIIITVVSELRIMSVEKKHKEYVKKAKEINTAIYDTSIEALSYVDATWTLLIERKNDGEDIESLIEEKRKELEKGDKDAKG